MRRASFFFLTRSKTDADDVCRRRSTFRTMVGASSVGNFLADKNGNLECVGPDDASGVNKSCSSLVHESQAPPPPTAGNRQPAAGANARRGPDGLIALGTAAPAYPERVGIHRSDGDALSYVCTDQERTMQLLPTAVVAAKRHNGCLVVYPDGDRHRKSLTCQLPRLTSLCRINDASDLSVGGAVLRLPVAAESKLFHITASVATTTLAMHIPGANWWPINHHQQNYSLHRKLWDADR